MLDLLWLIPTIPLAGYLVLAVGGKRMSPRAVAAVGVGSVGASLAAAVAVLAGMALTPAGDARTRQVLWTWIDVGEFEPSIALSLDALSAVMVAVVTVVGFLIHVFAAGFMREDSGYSRFFAYMNLFVGFMLVLVLADNLLLLYLGWEGVGLCSYLLIGFWYREPKNGAAAQKAFVVTRIGDAALAVGLFILFFELGTLDIVTAMNRAEVAWPAGSASATLAAALLLAGAVGKSAQIPLQTWLPDAMAGPTPVSALIHAATMVTAGVYLIARAHPLFELAPAVMTAIAVIGAVTLLVAAASALYQRDIKRVLAYSTISQLGYMMLALGVGAYSAAIFHLVTHALFKALLFLAAGSIIFALRGEHDLDRMGGLRRDLPVAFWTFTIAAASLAALPVVTAGYYSKDMILVRAWQSGGGGAWLWAAGLAGALLTAIYIFRAVFLAFFGERVTATARRPGAVQRAPLIFLAAGSIAAGLIETPDALGGVTLLSDMLEGPLPAAAEHGEVPALVELAAIAASLGGIAIAYLAFVRGRRPVTAIPRGRLERFAGSGFGFDAAYDRAIVRPLWQLARAGRHDVLDHGPAAVAALARAGHRALSRTQSGRLRRYVGALALGTVIFAAVVVLS